MLTNASKKMCGVIPLCFLILIMVFSFTPASIYGAGKNFPNIKYTSPERVGAGVTFRRATEESKHWEICIVEVDLSNPNVDIEVLNPIEKPLETTSKQATAANAIAAVNGTFFNMENAQYFGFHKADSKIVRCYKPATSFVRDPTDPDDNTEPAPPFKQPWYAFGLWGPLNKKPLMEAITPCGESVSGNKDWSKTIDVLSSYPNLVKDGKIDYDQVNGTLFGWEKVTAQRTWLGFDTKTNKLYFVTVDGRINEPKQGEKARVGMTCLEEAQFLLDLGCDYGLNYDGGGSTTCWVNGEVKNHLIMPERPVATVWAIIPANIVDNQAKECGKTGASWKEGEYSDSYYLNSLKIGTDDKATTVAWKPNLEEKGSYDVFVWYPEDVEQSDSVTYKVVDDKGEHEVKVNQRRGGGQWNKLGSYSFSPGSKGHVSVSNAALSSGYFLTDAVKFLYKKQ